MGARRDNLDVFGAIVVVLFVGFLVAVFFFTEDVSPDFVFIVIDYVVLYGAMLCIVGGPILFALCFIGMAIKDLYGAFKLEFAVSDREKMDRFFIRIRNKFLMRN